MAHKCNFFLMWNLSRQLHNRGLRTAGSHAALDSLLEPGSPCRVRIQAGRKLHPFAWWPAPRFNVVLTEGGLIVSGIHSLKDAQAAGDYSLNKVLSIFGAGFLPGTQEFRNKRVPLMRVDENWQITHKSESESPVVAKHTYGKGRVVLLASDSLFHFNGKDPADAAQKADFLAEQIKWAAGGSEPAGGPARLPMPMSGGGGIYPEQETRVEGIVVYYSKNQIPVLLQTVRQDFPAITRQLYEWYPSSKPEEPMYLILCSSGGGGWAVNAYYPKEVGTITTKPEGLRSIFAHEQAHTMAGACQAANHPFGGNRGGRVNRQGL